MLRREETDGGVAATGRLRQHDRNRPSGLRRSDQRLPRRLSEGRGLTTLRGRAAPAAGKAGVSVVRRAGQPDNARSEGLCGRAHGLPALPCALRHERMFLRIDAAQAGLACTLAGALTWALLPRDALSPTSLPPPAHVPGFLERRLRDRQHYGVVRVAAHQSSRSWTSCWPRHVRVGRAPRGCGGSGRSGGKP